MFIPFVLPILVTIYSSRTHKHVLIQLLEKFSSTILYGTNRGTTKWNIMRILHISIMYTTRAKLSSPYHKYLGKDMRKCVWGLHQISPQRTQLNPYLRPPAYKPRYPGSTYVYISTQSIPVLIYHNAKKQCIKPVFLISQFQKKCKRG